MKPARKIAAGDVLWYGGSRRRHDAARLVTVEKAGRLWITVEGGERFSAVTLRSEHNSERRLYADEAEQIAEVALSRAWGDFRQRVGGFASMWVPPGVTLDTIRQADALLWPTAADTAP